MNESRQAYKTIVNEHFREVGREAQSVIVFMLCIFNLKQNKYDLHEKYYLELTDEPGALYSIHSPNRPIALSSDKFAAEHELYKLFMEDNINGHILANYTDLKTRKA